MSIVGIPCWQNLTLLRETLCPDLLCHFNTNGMSLLLLCFYLQSNDSILQTWNQTCRHRLQTWSPVWSSVTYNKPVTSRLLYSIQVVLKWLQTGDYLHIYEFHWAAVYKTNSYFLFAPPPPPMDLFSHYGHVHISIHTMTRTFHTSAQQNMMAVLDLSNSEKKHLFVCCIWLNTMW